MSQTFVTMLQRKPMERDVLWLVWWADISQCSKSVVCWKIHH